MLKAKDNNKWKNSLKMISTTIENHQYHYSLPKAQNKVWHFALGHPVVGKLLLIFLGLRILKISHWTSSKNQSPKILYLVLSMGNRPKLYIFLKFFIFGFFRPLSILDWVSYIVQPYLLIDVVIYITMILTSWECSKKWNWLRNMLSM